MKTRYTRIDKLANESRVFCSQWIVRRKKNVQNIIFLRCSRARFRMECIWIFAHLEFQSSECRLFRMPLYIYIELQCVCALYCCCMNRIECALFSILFIITLVSWKTNSYHIFSADLAMSVACFCCVFHLFHLLLLVFLLLCLFKRIRFLFKQFLYSGDSTNMPTTAIRLFCDIFFFLFLVRFLCDR